jgi:NAD(P)H-quinone oxidoreductase subunit I
MNLATMLKDVTQSLLKRPVTQKYPFEKLPAPARLRGKLKWNAQKCTGCALCVKDCPADAIELVVNDKKAKVFVMRYNADRCIYCAQCTANCRFNCLEMDSEDWELAALTKEPFLMFWGPEEHVNAYLASLNAPAEEPAGSPTYKPEDHEGAG